MGREACYTGQEITWDQIMNSTQNLVPENMSFTSMPPHAVAVPGVTQIDRTYASM